MVEVEELELRIRAEGHVLLLLLAACVEYALASPFYWPNIKHVFSFGDSYTDTYSRFVNGTLTASQDSRVRGVCPHLRFCPDSYISRRQVGRCGLSG